MAHEGTFRFTITATLKTDSTSVRTALVPLVEEILQEEIHEQGLPPLDESAWAGLSSDVLARAMGQMAGESPEGLVKALLERAVLVDLSRRLPGSRIDDATVEVERTE